VLPVSLSMAGGPLHRQLRGYKDHACSAARDSYTRTLAAVLDRFLGAHERCLAACAGVPRFALATTVPSRSAAAEGGPGRLELIVARLCAATANRHAPLLAPGPQPGERRAWSPERYRARRALRGEAVLLVDDTWTSGASAQAAAHALRRAGAGTVALVVIGRHVQMADCRRAGWSPGTMAAFRWDRCALGAACVAPELQPARVRGRAPGGST
jgi:hypothetical protein